MNGVIAWWAKNSVAANLLMFACLIVGVLSFLRIDREVFPSGEVPFVQVSIVWPGADSQQVEEQLILRIEESVADTEGLEHVSATAREGSAIVTIEASSEIDIDVFLNDIKNRVDGISTFPNNAFPPTVQKFDTSDRTHLIAIAGKMDERELNRLARRLRDEVTQIPNGSSKVGLFGDRMEEVSIEVSEAALRGFGLTFNDVAQAIRGRSINRSSGTIQTETGNVPLAARGLANTQQEFENIVIRQNADGGIIRVKDVATVIDGFEDRNSKRELDGDGAILLWIEAPVNFNIVELAKSVDQFVEDKNKELNPRARLSIIQNSSEIYFARMKLVSSNAIIGLFLVLVTLILFLRPVVALWVSVGIAISFAGAFIFLPAVGVSLNILSLFAFLLVIGVVVDDAIIVGESIHNQVEDGKTGLDAALVGTQLVIKPVFFAVLTTMIAFAPWLFLSGGTSEFTKHISWTIIFALTFSLIESFLILPAHLSHMKPQDKNSFFYRLQAVFSEGLINFANTVYQPVLRKALRMRALTVPVFLVGFAVSIALVAQGWIKFSFFPTVEGSTVSLDVNMVEGTSYNRTLQVYDRVKQSAEEVKAEYGKGVNGEDIIETIFIRANEGFVGAFMTAAETEERGNITIEEISEKWRSKIGEVPDAEEISATFSFNDDGADLSFGLESDNLESIRLAMIDLQNYLRGIPGVYDIQNNLQSATDELRINLKPGAERFGLTLAEVSNQIRQAFFGEEVQRLPRGGDDVRVMVRLPKADRTNLNTLSKLFIRTVDGREVPLSAVADVEFAPSFKRIQRRDRKRSARISAELVEGLERRDIMMPFNRNFRPEWQSRHPDVEITRRGQAEAQQEFNNELTTLYIIAFFAIYMVLAIAFSSYIQPVLIMSAIPFGFMGAMFGHALLGVELGLFSIFGIGAAAGVVINDNLVLIDYVNRLRREGAGAVEALVRAGTGRFRPIILTSITTFIGLVPVMLETSIDAQFLKPTIVSMAFGIFFAAFVTLLFVPAMYLVGADIARFYRWAWTGETQAKVGEGLSMEHGYGAPDARMDAPHPTQGENSAFSGEAKTRRNPLVGPAE